jgi:hypothetical protein
MAARGKEVMLFSELSIGDQALNIAVLSLRQFCFPHVSLSRFYSPLGLDLLQYRHMAFNQELGASPRDRSSLRRFE